MFGDASKDRTHADEERLYSLQQFLLHIKP